MIAIDYLVFATYFAVETFAHISLGFFWLAVMLLAGRFLVGERIALVIVKRAQG